jgi:hypothetical protein
MNNAGRSGKVRYVSELLDLGPLAREEELGASHPTYARLALLAVIAITGMGEKQDWPEQASKQKSCGKH